MWFEEDAEEEVAITSASIEHLESSDELSFALHESRAWRKAARESPGGDRRDTAPAHGVDGIVPSDVFPKRQRRGKPQWPSSLDKADELSVSDPLVFPISVVSSSTPSTLCDLSKKVFTDSGANSRSL
jgi:hypothetical protein